MTEKSEDQVVWVDLKRGCVSYDVYDEEDVAYVPHSKYLILENNLKEARNRMLEYHSKYLALKSDLAVAVEALEAIKLVAFENMEGQTHLSREYEMAKEALGKIGEIK